MAEIHSFGDFQLETAVLTSVGRVRDHNEDFVHIEVPEDLKIRKEMGILAIVADGMGGHAAGEVASQVTIETIVDIYYSYSPSIPTLKALSIAAQKANTKVLEIAENDQSKRGMGTTISLALFKENKVYILNVGDSRTSILRNGEFKQITVDHSYVQELGLNEEQARYSPFKNRITRAVGYQPDMEIDTFEEDLKEDDLYVLYTDGIVNHLFPSEIESILKEDADLSRKIEKLISETNERGGTDNSTVILIKVGKSMEKEPKDIDSMSPEKSSADEKPKIEKGLDAKDESKDEKIDLPKYDDAHLKMSITEKLLVVIATLTLIIFIFVLSQFFKTTSMNVADVKKTEVKKSDDTKKEEEIKKEEVKDTENKDTEKKDEENKSEEKEEPAEDKGE
ncbi:MAG: serine/threonine-protein phosphatase [Candidatus Coatesbacteria bacterium]|nr:serine/threonine-protein phosphatase [Candidatus Coatesbacteria bacterium]